MMIKNPVEIAESSHAATESVDWRRQVMAATFLCADKEQLK